MNSLAFFGVGSNYYTNLSTTSFGIEIQPNQWMLVDCGPDIPRQVRKAGVSFLNISTVILTHRHLDHCLGLPYLLFGRNLDVLAKKGDPSFKDSGIQIIAERSLYDSVMEFFKYCHPDIPSLSFDLKFVDIETFEDKSLAIDDCDLKFFRMDHTVPAYGFRITDSKGKSLAYSSDTLPCEEFIEGAKGVDILIHEAMVPESEKTFSVKAKHSTGLNAGEVTKRIGPKQAFLVHIRPPFWDNRKQIEDEASTIANITMIYPDEGSTIPI